ncbi:AfsR/SARP family transcriptional regulator, partial [Calidithermus chliarophilus]|uniref:AfsR/SARP family transcriptional regulator n=1 Tax=Calidithermus chliarophilus TaxID=52023 RepID=UPI00055B4530
MTWSLRLLGQPSLTGQGRTAGLERKPAALLAYLALEGPTRRTRLAGLLWPGLDEGPARNNLRQALFNLRRFEGLLQGGDPLQLGPGVESDVALLQERAAAPRPDDPPQAQGELLEGHDYDDCPEFGEWLLHERERLRELRREALGLLCERLEREGGLAEALSWAQRLLEADPISEASHRRVMRLHYLLGDRAAALRAYQRCA